MLKSRRRQRGGRDGLSELLGVLRRLFFGGLLSGFGCSTNSTEPVVLWNVFEMYTFYMSHSGTGVTH